MTYVHDPVGPGLLRTPTVKVTGAAGGPYTVDTAGGLGAWVIVKIAGLPANTPAGSLVQLPNGLAYPVNAEVLLTADEAAQITAPVGVVTAPTAITGADVAPATGDDFALKLTAPGQDLTAQAVVRAVSGALRAPVPQNDVRDWLSSSTATATVDRNGLVTAKSITPGTTNITAKWGGYTATAGVVTVAA